MFTWKKDDLWIFLLSTEIFATFSAICLTQKETNYLQNIEKDKGKNSSLGTKGDKGDI